MAELFAHHDCPTSCSEGELAAPVPGQSLPVTAVLEQLQEQGILTATCKWVPGESWYLEMLGLGTHKRGFCLQTLTGAGSGLPLSEPHGEGLKADVFLVSSDLTVVGKKSYLPCIAGLPHYCKTLPVLCGAWDSVRLHKN